MPVVLFPVILTLICTACKSKSCDCISAKKHIRNFYFVIRKHLIVSNPCPPHLFFSHGFIALGINECMVLGHKQAELVDVVFIDCAGKVPDNLRIHIGRSLKVILSLDRWRDEDEADEKNSGDGN